MHNEAAADLHHVLPSGKITICHAHIYFILDVQMAKIK